MTTEASRPRQRMQLVRPAVDFEFSRFLFDVSAVPGVVKIGYGLGVQQVDLGVLTERENFDANDAVFDLLDAYRERAELSALELHIVPLDHVRAENLPAFTTLFEKR